MTTAAPINVLHISTPKTWRGGEQQIAYLLGSLPENEVHNIVLAPENSVLSHYCQKQGVQHLSLPTKFPAKLLNPFRLKRLCQAHDIHLIHLHDAHAHSLAIYSVVFARLALPFILSRRVDFPIQPNWFSRFKYNHHRIQAIICVSEVIQDILTSQVQHPQKLEVVHSGIDLDRFSGIQLQGKLRQAWQVPEDRWLIGNTSAIADHKDYFTFVDTAEYLLNQKLKAHFFIIGSGPEKAQIQQYITEKGLRDHIHLTGFREDLPSLLPELDCYLMSSKTEGLGTSILDAFAAGVPVVATQAGGIPEMVIHEETGLLAPIGNPEALGKAVLRLLENAEIRNQIIKGAAHKVEDFSKEKMAERTLGVYQRGLENDSP